MDAQEIIEVGEKIFQAGMRVEGGDTVLQSETKLEGILMAAGVAIGLGVWAYTTFQRTTRTQAKR